MSNETTVSAGSDQLDMGPVETAVALLRKACDKAVDDLGGAVPGVQLRALLVVNDAGGSLDLPRLAAEMTASVSATSRVCERMREAGLLATEHAAGSRPGSRCMLTGLAAAGPLDQGPAACRAERRGELPVPPGSRCAGLRAGGAPPLQPPEAALNACCPCPCPALSAAGRACR